MWGPTVGIFGCGGLCTRPWAGLRTGEMCCAGSRDSLVCDPQGAGKCAEPRHDKRVNGVRSALRQAGLRNGEINMMLARAEPPPVVFSNRLEAGEDECFARQEIRANVRRGSVLLWPFRNCRPPVVLALAVARHAEGKPRLILDARNVNPWLAYMPFSFETLAD